MTIRKFVRDSVGYAAAQFMVRAVMIARTVLAARWLGPQTFGAWNALQLVMDYGALAPLGTQQGLDQSVPRAMVDGDATRLARVKRSGFTNSLLLTLVYCGGCLLYFRGSTGNVMAEWGWMGLLVAMAIVVMCNWANYHTGLLRSSGNIGAVSLWFFVQGMIGGLLGLVLIRGIGGWGLLWGWFAGTLIAFAWTRWEARRIAPLQPLVSHESAMLLRTGFPLFFFLGTSLIIRSLDRLVILRFLGTRELGYYSLAVTAVTLLLYLPDSTTYVFYPRLLQRFRAEGDRPEAVRDSVLSVLRVLTTLTPALGGLAFLAARELMWMATPNFVPGASAVRIMCFTAGAICITNLASIVLMTLGRQVWLMPAAIVFAAAFVAADVIALQMGFGITGVAWATLGTYVVTGALLLLLALSSLKMGRLRVVRELAFSFWGLACAIVIAGLSDRLVPGQTDPRPAWRWIHILFASIVFSVLYVLAVMPLLRGLGIRQVVADLNLPFARFFKRGPNGTGVA